METLIGLDLERVGMTMALVRTLKMVRATCTIYLVTITRVSKNVTVLAKKWGDTEIAKRGCSVPVMRARYRSVGLTPHQPGWTDSG